MMKRMQNTFGKRFFRVVSGLCCLGFWLVAAAAIAIQPAPSAVVQEAWESFHDDLRFLELQDRLGSVPAETWLSALLPAWSPSRRLGEPETGAKPVAEPLGADLELTAGAALGRILEALPSDGPANDRVTWRRLLKALGEFRGASAPAVRRWVVRALDALELRLRHGRLHETTGASSVERLEADLRDQMTELRCEMAGTGPRTADAQGFAAEKTLAADVPETADLPDAAGVPDTADISAAPNKRSAPSTGGSDIRRERFLWGVSTAGYQWEGANPQSIWAFHEARGKTEEPSKKAANGLELYETDVALAASMGLTAFRTSIEWSRIEPVPGSFDPEGVAFYHRLFRCIRDHGMQPVVTLVHFSWPQWLEDAMGGWVTRRGQQAFRRYVEFVAREYGDEVDWWLTFNEPMVCIGAGYILGVNAPGYKNPVLALRVSKAWVDCHRQAYEIIHANDPKAFVSFNNYTGTYQLAGKLEGHALALAGSPFAKQVREVCDAVRRQWLDLGFDGGRAGGKPRALDYIGVDYYCRWKIPGKFLPAHEWEVYPEGLYQVLHNYYNWFKVPVLIAENGMATRDHAPRPDGWTREAYLVQHVKVMQKAMRDGIPVLGYIHWSITDNYEWGSFSPRFGLFAVDCRNQRFERVPTPSVEIFRKIVAAGGVTPELLQAWPAPKATAAGMEVGF